MLRSISIRINESDEDEEEEEEEEDDDNDDDDDDDWLNSENGISVWNKRPRVSPAGNAKL